MRGRGGPAVLALVALACTRGGSEPEPVRIGTGVYGSLAAAGGTVVVHRVEPVPGAPAEEIPRDAYETLDLATDRLTPVRLPDLAGCERTRYRDLFALNEREVGAVRDCMNGDPDDGRGERHAVVAYDPRSGTVREVLAPVPPDLGWRWLPGGDLLGVDEDTYCPRLLRYRPPAAKPVPLGVSLAEDGWALDNDGGP